MLINRLQAASRELQKFDMSADSNASSHYLAMVQYESNITAVKCIWGCSKFVIENDLDSQQRRTPAVVPLQKVKVACHTDPSNIVILPFDLLDSTGKLEAAAAAADSAFGAAGIDYLVNNAGGFVKRCLPSVSYAAEQAEDAQGSGCAAATMNNLAVEHTPVCASMQCVTHYTYA